MTAAVAKKDVAVPERLVGLRQRDPSRSELLRRHLCRDQLTNLVIHI
jgi:hypothetical protein